MFSRTRAALGMALLLSLIASITAFAKGGFDFVTITGPNIKETVRLTDPAWTDDFFIFANFHEDKTKAPADPGVGYEILRYYGDGQREIVFDRLHYYPEAGFVFYDGIENGESEYDGEWYTANPEIKAVFESALSMGTGAPVENKELIPASSQPQAEDPTAKSQPGDSRFESLPLLMTIIAAGLAALFAFVFGRRKPSTQ